MTPDLRLLHQYASTGDAEAFSAIVQAYQDLVYSACLRMWGNAADTEDAAQDCFLQLARNAGKVRSSVAGWLHRRATHHCLELVRQAAARRQREREYEEMRAAERAARNDGVSWEEIAPEVDRAVDELPNEERHALVEHFLRQRTQAEIAEELGVSAATASRRVNSGVEQVRNRLKDAGVVVPSAVLAALLAQNAAGAAPATLAAAVSRLSAEAAARRSGESAPTSSHLTSHLPGALRGKAAVAAALGLLAIVGGTWYWQAARAKREAAARGGYENGVNANVRREAQGESRQVLLENVVQTFDQVVRETVQPYGAPRSAVTTHLVCMRAAGWEDADYETLMTISGFGISFVYEHKDKFWVAWVPPPGADERIARATGFGWEWVRSQTPDEAWNALKKTIDAGKPARAPSEEELIFAGYQEAPRKTDRKAFVLEVPHAYPGKSWTWQEFEKWFKQQSHGYLGRHTGRVAKAAPREMATEVMRNIVTWADKHPMASDEGFAGVSFGLAGTEAYAAEIEDMSKPPSYFNLGWLGLYSIYPQWTARQCTARYLQRVAQEFATPVSSHILAAAQQYESAYGAWQEWETHLGRLGPRGKAPENAWESEEHRKAGAAAVRQALEREKAAIAELAKALELLH